ncbi:MAG: hypothetical protein ACRDOI_40730 [Trebonia sp.]
MDEAEEKDKLRLLDLEGVIERRLGMLAYQDYLCAMCVIAEAIAGMYSEYYPTAVRGLAQRTVDAAKVSLRDGEEAGVAAAARLPEEWTSVLKDENAVDGPPGAGTALVMFAALSDEISLAGRRQGALTFVTASVATYPGKSYTRPEAEFVFPLEERKAEADESSPGVQLLLKFGEVAALAEEQSSAGVVRDPEAIRGAVFS